MASEGLSGWPLRNTRTVALSIVLPGFVQSKGIAMLMPKDWFILNQCILLQRGAKVRVGSAKIQIYNGKS